MDSKEKLFFRMPDFDQLVGKDKEMTQEERLKDIARQLRSSDSQSYRNLVLGNDKLFNE